MLNPDKIKKDFPIFGYRPHLVYLDSTATSLKPRSVIKKLVEYYEQYSANVFRGIYEISEKATEEYEMTRKIVAQFINSRSSDEIIFTRNTSESINLIAYGLGRKIVGQGDEVVTTVMEHHSNFVAWQILAGEAGAVFKVVDINDNGLLDLGLENIKYQRSNIKKNLEKIINNKTKILALTYISNVLGTVNPIKEITKIAKEINPSVIVVVDAAQAAPHQKIDVEDLGCDFIAFSGHKMLGPTGVGVLWGRKHLLADMFPFNYGGEMIKEVYLDRTVFKEAPHKFEAGTPAIGEVIAFKEAVKCLKEIGLENIHRHEQELSLYCFKSLKSVFGRKIKIIGQENFDHRAGIIAFNLVDYHSHDIAQILSAEDICVRAGSHCAMPLHQRFGIISSVRASFYLYNTKNDVDALIKGLEKSVKILG